MDFAGAVVMHHVSSGTRVRRFNLSENLGISEIGNGYLHMKRMTSSPFILEIEGPLAPQYFEVADGVINPFA